MNENTPELEQAPARDRHCLLIDLGNSRVKWITALWHALSGEWNLDVTSFGEGDPEDLAAALDSGEMLPPEEVLLCSVASKARSTEVEDVIAERSSAEIVRMTSRAETRGVHNGYRRAEKLGADRWMAVVGAALHHGVPVVVMDVGTATTLDAVDPDGKHLGGMILPGPRTMLDSLAVKTALGMDASLDFGAASSAAGKRHRDGVPQRETLAAIEAGVVSAQSGALSRFVARFEESLGNGASEIRVVITGGGAGVILNASDCQLTHDPLLVFRGMLFSRYAKDNGQDDYQGN